MKNQSKRTPPKEIHNSLTMDTNLNKMVKMTVGEFQIWIIRKLSEIQEKIEPQHKEAIKTMQDMNEKFSKEIEVLKKKPKQKFWK